MLTFFRQITITKNTDQLLKPKVSSSRDEQESNKMHFKKKLSKPLALGRINHPALSREMAHKGEAAGLFRSCQLFVNGLVHREISQEKRI